MKKVIILGGMILLFLTIVIPLQFNEENNYINENDSVKKESLAIFEQQDDGSYDQVETVPLKSSGKIFDKVKSICDGDAQLKWNNDDWNVSITNLNRVNDKCYLYFSNSPNNIFSIIQNKEIKTRYSFSHSITTNNTGILYTAEDDDGTSYYYVGLVEDNYVKFAGFYWRIIRFNGDGSMRLIYQGTTSSSIGTDAQIGTSMYNSSYNRSEYVGFTYNIGSQRTIEGTSSIIKQTLDNWYNINLASQEAKIADGKFCNDRNVSPDYNWSSTSNSNFYYAGYGRILQNKNPSFKCGNVNDIYKLKVGLLTADELIMAGGSSSGNNSYYLYTGQNYWTITPYGFSSSNANTFVVDSGGSRASSNVSREYGVRPVINLKADTIFSSGNGTASNPYVVV